MRIKFENILFIDIETVGIVQSFEQLSESLKLLWEKKCKTSIKEYEEIGVENCFESKAAIFSEFGKIVNISVGKLFYEKNSLSIKSFHSENELDILKDFKNFIEKYDQDLLIFCGHNIKEFDIPYICRRMVLNSIELPKVLNISAKKPWEIKNLDTMEMWSFGDKKNFTSLELLATIFNIPSPKENMSGSDVHRVFYQEKNLEKISKYCNKDVLTVVNLFLKMKNLNLVNNFDFK
jgi:DNA polymerase elongation subunit (family B)